MSYAEYQEHFDNLAQELEEKYAAMSPDELVQLVKDKQYGECYQLWHSLLDRVSPQQINLLLQQVLNSKEDYLHRYHCAAAYIAINGLSDYGPHQLSAYETEPVAKNLSAVFARVNSVQQGESGQAK